MITFILHQYYSCITIRLNVLTFLQKKIKYKRKYLKKIEKQENKNSMFLAFMQIIVIEKGVENGKLFRFIYRKKFNKIC